MDSLAADLREQHSCTMVVDASSDGAIIKMIVTTFMAVVAGMALMYFVLGWHQPTVQPPQQDARRHLEGHGDRNRKVPPAHGGRDERIGVPARTARRDEKSGCRRKTAVVVVEENDEFEHRAGLCTEKIGEDSEPHDVQDAADAAAVPTARAF